MTCLHLNPSLDKSKLLDATQVASMKIHVIEALKVAQDFLFPTQKTTAAAAAAQPQTPAATAASKTQPGYIDFDSVDMYSAFGNESGRALLILHSALAMLLLNSRHMLH